jgi:proteasome lid subunit RPN8/RPN11
MEAIDYYDPPGNAIDPTDLRVKKAKELLMLLQDGVFPFMSFVECRRMEEGEVVVLDIEPEVPQHLEHDIRMVERVAVVFDEEDQKTPEPLALRKSFPLAPHENIRPEGTPRSLCLHEERYEERRSQWTAAIFVRRLQTWLSRTARGEVHEDDQPLERLFLGTTERIVLPSALYGTEATSVPERLLVYYGGKTRGQPTFVAVQPEYAQPWESKRSLSFLGFAYDAEPRTHGLIRIQPQNLKELADFLAEEEEDLLSTLRDRLWEWKDEHLSLSDRLILVVRVPKRRSEDGPIEDVEMWAFLAEGTVGEVGEDIDAWQLHEGEPGRPLDFEPSSRGENIRLSLLNPTQSLNPSLAAAMNGLNQAPDVRHVAVGMGALGSQVFMNLVRAGQGVWTVIDEDQLLPHNLARHVLHGGAIGRPKAESVAAYANSLFEEDIVTSVVANVLTEKQKALGEIFGAADSILDMSASVTVARHLAVDVESQAQRVSLFLSPHGWDLALIAEPADRSLRLDQLEMEYYRALVTRDGLENHLLQNGERVRYANACRDVSTELPQDLTALHAATGARAYRRVVGDDVGPTVEIWRAHDDGTVNSMTINPAGHQEFDVGEWTVSVSQRLLRNMREQRSSRQPNETGGVLIGAFDTERRRVYVVHHIPSPPDSEEWPTAYRRGIVGLQEQLSKIDQRTAGQLEYVGEWHSHPDGASTQASEDDIVLFEWLSGHRRMDGLPAVMAIVGDANRSRWFLGALSDDTETVVDG